VPAGQNDEKTVVLLHLDEAEGSTSFVNSAEAATNPADPVTAHEDRRDNPHEVTKAQVDLTNVTDDAQLKRAAGDIATFPEKATPVAADKVLLEDSADSGAKKWAEVQNLPAGGTGAPTTAEYIVGAMDATLSAERLIQGPSGGGNETQGVKVDLATGGACKLIGLSSIFITDVTSSGGSAISDKNYTGTTSPANKIIADADSDGDVTIHVEVDAGPASSVGRGWQPAVTVRGGDSPVAVTLTQIDNSRRFSGTAVVSTGTPGDYTIYADATDGGRSQDITLTRTASPPLVLRRQRAVTRTARWHRRRSAPMTPWISAGQPNRTRTRYTSRTLTSRLARDSRGRLRLRLASGLAQSTSGRARPRPRSIRATPR
jgi:hypothetical protein